VQSPRQVQRSCRSWSSFPFRASQTKLKAHSAFTFPPSVFTPLGVDPRRIRPIRDRHLSATIWASLLGFTAPSTTCCSTGTQRLSRTRRCASHGLSYPSTHKDGEFTNTGLPKPAAAPFMPILTASTTYTSHHPFRGIIPVTFMGFLRPSRVFPAWIGHRHRLPPFLVLRSPTQAPTFLHLQGINLQNNP